MLLNCSLSSLTPILWCFRKFQRSPMWKILPKITKCNVCVVQRNILSLRLFSPNNPRFQRGCMSLAIVLQFGLNFSSFNCLALSYRQLSLNIPVIKFIRLSTLPKMVACQFNTSIQSFFCKLLLNDVFFIISVRYALLLRVFKAQNLLFKERQNGIYLFHMWYWKHR